MDPAHVPYAHYGLLTNPKPIAPNARYVPELPLSTITKKPLTLNFKIISQIEKEADLWS